LFFGHFKKFCEDIPVFPKHIIDCFDQVSGVVILLIMVGISATGVAEFFIGSAAKGILAPKAIAGWFCKGHNFFQQNSPARFAPQAFNNGFLLF
jgi:hypothetical protein